MCVADSRLYIENVFHNLLTIILISPSDAKTRLPSEDTSDSKSKSPPASKSPPSQSDDTSEAGGPSTRQWVRLHYRPGEETKSVSSERLSVQVRFSGVMFAEQVLFIVYFVL